MRENLAEFMADFDYLFRRELNAVSSIRPERIFDGQLGSHISNLRRGNTFARGWQFFM